jgi:hypothetical protein
MMEKGAVLPARRDLCAFCVRQKSISPRDDKKFARVQILKTIVDPLEEKL